MLSMAKLKKKIKLDRKKTAYRIKGKLKDNYNAVYNSNKEHLHK